MDNLAALGISREPQVIPLPTDIISMSSTIKDGGFTWFYHPQMHKAVAEVSKIGNLYRRGELLWYVVMHGWQSESTDALSLSLPLSTLYTLSSIYPSMRPVHLFIHPSIYLSVYLSIWLSIRLSAVYPSVCLSVYLSIRVSVYLFISSIHPSIHLSPYPSVYLSIYLCIYLSIDLVIYLTIYLSAYLFIWLPVYLIIWFFPPPLLHLNLSISRKFDF